MAAELTHEVLLARDLDSSVAELILSSPEGLLRNDMVRFEVDARVETPGSQTP